MSTAAPAAPKKRRATAAPSSSAPYEATNERLEFRKCLAELAHCKQAFAEAVEKCHAFEEETLESLSLQLTEKKAELAELQAQFAVERKNAEIKLAQEVAEFRYKAAVDILSGRGEQAVATAELEELRAKCAAAAAQLDAECKRVREEERAAGHAQLGAAIKSKELEHKANMAELNAKVEQQKLQIASMQAQLEAYSKEVDKQRELTKQVADAGRHGAIQQTIGKT